MNSKYLQAIRDSEVWNKDFSDYDDILDNGILECEEIDLTGKFMFSVLRTSQMIEEILTKMLFEHDLSLPQLAVIETLYFGRQKNLSQEKLSKMIFCSKANISSLLNRMEEKKLIIRKENPANKREKIVQITREGENKLYEVFVANHQNCMRSSIIEDEMAKKFVTSLKNVREKIREKEDGYKK
ncbi:MAG: MarR family winged helix-turn-helix transcriptional regulator [Nanoarchaeota archaeon]